MDIRIQIFVIIFVVLAMTAIIVMIRNRALELRYALIWLLAGLAIFILTLFPGITLWISGLIGVLEPINMLFFLGFIFSLAIIFTLTVALSRSSKKIKNLTQAMGSMEERLRNLEKEGENK